MRLILTIIISLILLGAAFTANEEVTSTKLNTFNNANIDTSAGVDPEKIDDHSASNAEQDTTSDPYLSDAQTLATDLSLEIRQLRFQIQQIIRGNTNAGGTEAWYRDPTNYLGAPSSLTQGDTFFYNRGGDVARLAAGTDGQFLKAQGANSDLVWGSALSMPASTTQGDVLYVNVSNALARLGAATSGQALKTQGSNQNPVWANFVSGAASDFISAPASTTQGDILYRDASASDWVRLPAGTSGNVLTTQAANNNPKWASSSSLTSRARGKRTTNQSITLDTWTKVQLNAEDYDVDSEFDSTTNYRFTATTTGGYAVSAGANGGNSATVYRIQIYKNGAALNPQITATEVATVGTETNHTEMFIGSTNIALNANDYLELFAYTSGTDNVVVAFMEVRRVW